MTLSLESRSSSGELTRLPDFTIPSYALPLRTCLYHHRGQLSVYLRLLDVPVPVIYGRGGDENSFT
jgi:hypothetical protein